MKTVYRTGPVPYVKTEFGFYEWMEKWDDNTCISMKEVHEDMFLRVQTVPHALLGMDKKERFRSRNYYYKRRTKNKTNTKRKGRGM